MYCCFPYFYFSHMKRPHIKLLVDISITFMYTMILYSFICLCVFFFAFIILLNTQKIGINKNSNCRLFIYFSIFFPAFFNENKIFSVFELLLWLMDGSADQWSPSYIRGIVNSTVVVFYNLYFLLLIRDVCVVFCISINFFFLQQQQHISALNNFMFNFVFIIGIWWELERFCLHNERICNLFNYNKYIRNGKKNFY